MPLRLRRDREKKVRTGNPEPELQIRRDVA